MKNSNHTNTVSIDTNGQFKLKVRFDECLTTVVKLTNTQAWEMFDNGVNTTDRATQALKEIDLNDWKARQKAKSQLGV